MTDLLGYIARARAQMMLERSQRGEPPTTLQLRLGAYTATVLEHEGCFVPAPYDFSHAADLGGQTLFGMPITIEHAMEGFWLVAVNDEQRE